MALNHLSKMRLLFHRTRLQAADCNSPLEISHARITLGGRTFQGSFTGYSSKRMHPVR